MTKIYIDIHVLFELMRLKTGECLEVCDENGVEGYLTKSPEGEIEILDSHFNFEYYHPNEVTIHLWDETLTDSKKIGGTIL